MYIKVFETYHRWDILQRDSYECAPDEALKMHKAEPFHADYVCVVQLSHALSLL